MSALARVASFARFAVASNPAALWLPLPWCALVGWEFWNDDLFRFGLSSFAGWLALVMVPQIAIFVLAPSLAAGQSGANPMEFLMTRAIDRRQYHRALTAVYLTIALMPVALALLLGLGRPALQIVAYEDAKRDRYLSAFPGSYSPGSDAAQPYASRTVVIPDGRPRMAVVEGANVLVLALVMQAALLVLLRRRRRPWVAQVVMMTPAVGIMIGSSWSSLNEWLALRLGPSAWLLALALLPLFVVTQRIYERWFERLEFVSD